MKKTAKFFAVLLAVVMTFALVACEKGNEKAKTEEEQTTTQTDEGAPVKEDEEKAVREVLEKFLDASMENDLDTMEDCIASDSDAEEKLEENKDVSDEAEQIGISENEYMKIQKNIRKAAKKDNLYAYEIQEIEIDGDKAEVTVELTQPEPDDDHKYAQYSISDMVWDYLLEEEGYSTDELLEMTEEVAIAEYTAEAFEWIMLQIMEDADTKTEEGPFELEKIDGEWLITDKFEMDK